MNSLFNVYRPQGILMLLHTGGILAGSLTTRTLLKASGYPRRQFPHWDYPLFVRDWALLLLLIPIAWCFASIKFGEAANAPLWTQRATLLTGLVLLGLLVLAVMYSIGQTTVPESNTSFIL